MEREENGLSGDRGASEGGGRRERKRSQREITQFIKIFTPINIFVETKLFFKVSAHKFCWQYFQ